MNPPSLSAQVVHATLAFFPFVVLLLAPALAVLASLAAGPRRRRLWIAALVLMALGTASLYVAGSAGELARDEHRLSAALGTAVSEHRTLAREATTAFAAATVLMALFLLLTLRFRLRMFELDAVVTIGLLAFYAIGFLLLLKTFYRGGDLVHHLGI